MFRKYILVLSALFCLGVIADASADSASGFGGGFELKYKANLGSEGDKLGSFSYRARVNWAGEANSMVMWKVGLSSDLEQKFDTLDLNGVNLEQAYASYMPMDGFKIKIGKFGWMPTFGKSSVLYDDDLYTQGLMVNYKTSGCYAKVALINLTSEYADLYSAGGLLIGKLGTKQDLGDASVSVALDVKYDGLFRDSDATSVTTASAMVSVDVPNLGVPVSIVGNYGVNADTLLENSTYTVGVNVNQSDEMMMSNASIGVSYYNIDEVSWNTTFLNDDYTKGGTGVAAEVQYNIWENSKVVAKYAFDMSTDSDPHSLIGELTVNF